MAYSAVPFHGKLCRVEKNTVVMSYSKGWTLNVNLDMADTTAQPDAWKTGIPGMAGWNGSFEMYFVTGNTEQKAFFDNMVAAGPGTKLTDVQFNLDTTTNAFIGDIYVTGITINPSMGDVVSATVNFQGDDALSVSATA